MNNIDKGFMGSIKSLIFIELLNMIYYGTIS